MNYDVRLSSGFYDDARDIYDFLADLAGDYWAGRTMERIMRAIESSSIAFSPKSYHLDYDKRLGALGVRAMQIGRKYKAFFYIDEPNKAVVVVGLRSTAEDPRRATSSISSRL